MHEAIIVAELLAAAGAGLADGVFFAFSAFVMQGLQRLPAADGVKAINAINIAAVRPPLMILLFGTAAVCVAVIASLIVTWANHMPRWAETGATLSLAGAVFYMLGTALVTMERSMPLSRMLAEATDASGPMLWKIYLRDWVKWNHVRTAACAVACALLMSGTVLQSIRPMPPPYIADCMDLATGNMVPCY
jgi:uncharacterized membrane protein